jgi:hypothetical protein
MAMNDTILKLISVFWTDLFQELKGRSQSKSFIKLMMRFNSFKLVNCVLGLYFILFFYSLRTTNTENSLLGKN